MPRKRNRVRSEASLLAAGERKLKLFRLWLKAEHEALALRDALQERSRKARAEARTRRRLRALDRARAMRRHGGR